ncbi:MAG: tetratricopeptide repeat protein [Planctomycetes bacterium]|nr:tetratricopeptide repeat protein [Planctomycetota bacterium]
MRIANPIPFVLVCLTAASAVAQDSIKDSFTTTNGRRIRGVEITEMTASSIKFLRDGNQDELPAALLASVTWFQPPEQLALAHAAMRKREFDNAANLFEEVASKTDRDVLKVDAAFFSAKALARSAEEDPGRASMAVDKLKSFLSEHGENLRAAEAQLELGRAQLLAGDAVGAEQTLTELSSKVAAQGLDSLWDIRAKYEIAEAQLAQGKFAEARTSFRRAKTTASTVVAASADPVPQVEAYIAKSIVGEGETFIAEKKYDDAIRYFDRLQRDDNPLVAAAAKAGKGESLFLKAEADGKQDGLREAQIVLAEAILDDVASGSTTAKAMFYSGRVIVALGAERESSDFMARANDYFATVIAHYGDTAWAAKAKEFVK